MLILSINWTNYIILIGVVFLAVLAIIIHKHFEHKKEAKDNDKRNQEAISGATSAAIAMALHFYYADDIRDEENDIITIKTINSRYSPWSSKIYGIYGLQGLQ